MSVSGGLLLDYMEHMFTQAQIVVLNLGVHWVKANKTAYIDALRYTIPRLQKFDSGGGIGIIRETLPQHFKTVDGSGDYEQRVHGEGGGCARITKRDGGWRNQMLHQVAGEFGFEGIVPQWDALRPAWRLHKGGKDCTHWQQGKDGASQVMVLLAKKMVPFLSR